MYVKKSHPEDDNYTEAIKVRLNKNDYEALKKLALLNGTYIGTTARRAISKYLKDLGPLD